MNLIDRDMQTKWVPLKAGIFEIRRKLASPVDMRAKYVLRTRLSWTGLYGKAPWPRERKQWEKI